MFSPAPQTRRRATTTRNVSRATGQSPTPSDWRSTSGSRRISVGSRLTSPSRAGAVLDDVSMKSDITDRMDVDNEMVSVRERASKGAVLFAKSEEMTVVMHAPLPAEVLQILRVADFAREPFTGDVDTTTNFCYIASSKICFVWKYSQTLPGIPTCHIFPCPPNISTLTIPFICLPFFGPLREPALLLLSPTGEIRFWSSIGMGLTGGDHWDASYLDLNDGESVTALTRARSLSFVASTTAGRLFLLIVSSMSGKFNVTNHAFSLTRPQSTMARLRFWGTTQPIYSASNIDAVAIGLNISEGFEVWACMGSRLSKWTVMNEGWEQFEFEQDIREVIIANLLDAFPQTEVDNAIMDLELVDLSVDPENNIVVLASFAGREDESGIDTRPRRFYAVVRFSAADNTFMAESVHTVPYQTISADRAIIQPRLKLISGGALYCIQFGDTVAIVARGSEYNTCLTMKSVHDRTFGCGVLHDSCEMYLMNSRSLMRVEIDRESVSSFDTESGGGKLIKSTMTQAILYGANPDNPLLFSFPPDIDEEDLISGAEQLSRAVLATDIEIIRPNPDTTQQFITRRDRLKFLIEFINENGVLGKMSQTSRQRLLSDAEKLSAGQQLWASYCERIAAGHSQKLFAEAVGGYMADRGEGHHDDVLRAFFRLQTRDIAGLFPYLKQMCEMAQSSYELEQRYPRALIDANFTVLTILESAWTHRDANLGLYGIVLPILRPWTSEPSVIEIVTALFDLTANNLKNRADDEVPNADSTQLREHLSRLAAATFKCFQERVDWLESPAAADLQGTSVEKIDLSERYDAMRLPVLQTLYNNENKDTAFQLAEDYRDFRSLSELCHTEPPIYPPEENVHGSRVRAYIERFKDAFTTELYQWYIEHAELRLMFSQSDAYSNSLDNFFRKRPQPLFSWLHELDKERWGLAAQTLLSLSEHTSDIATRHLMLSIGKLSELAELSEVENAIEDPIMEVFHDGLDFVSVHHKLVEELKASLTASRQRQSLESQAEAVANAEAKTLVNRPALLTLFKQCVRNLLQGQVLTIEDTIDVLTLKDKSSDFFTALQLVKQMRNIPEARQISAMRSVWRRIINHDDWPEIIRTTNVTDNQLKEKFENTALYSVVADILAFEGDLDVNIPPPAQAEIIPTEDEISSRWPGHFPEQIMELVRDYQTEVRALRRIELDYVVDRVKELVRSNSHVETNE